MRTIDGARIVIWEGEGRSAAVFYSAFMTAESRLAPDNRSSRLPHAPLRVLQVISAAGRGGTERLVATLLKRSNASTLQQWVACDASGPAINEFRAHAAGVTTLDFRRWFDVSNVLALSRLMRDLRCDVVHTHLYRADVQAGLAAALAGVRVRIATIHGEYWKGGDSPRMARQLAMSRSYRAAYRLFDRVVVVAKTIADDLAERPGIRVVPSRVVVIRSGCDVVPPTDAAIAEARALLGYPTSPCIATVANFFHAKGHAVLLEALPAVLARFPQATLVLVGDGPLRSSIEEKARSMALERSIKFTGSLPDARPVLASADVIAMPSLTEGLPMVLLEALGLARPVVATRVGGIPEIVEDGRSALLVPPADAGALAAAIVRTLSNPDEGSRIGEQGRMAARTICSEAGMIRETERLYFSLAAEKGLAVPSPAPSLVGLSE